MQVPVAPCGVKFQTQRILIMTMSDMMQTSALSQCYVTAHSYIELQ